MTGPAPKVRRRDRAYIVTVGTRMYLARGADPDHALDLADLIGTTGEIAEWKHRVRNPPPRDEDVTG